MKDYYMEWIIGDAIKPIYNRIVEVADGIFVIAGKGNIKEPPDPCWFIMNEKRGIAGDNNTKAIYVFSNIDLVNNFMETQETQVKVLGYPRQRNWDDLVCNYEHVFKDAIVDMNIEDKFIQFIPLIKKDVLARLVD